MHYLAEGLVCLESPWNEHQLFDLRDSSSHTLSATQAKMVRRLIRGLPDDESEAAHQILDEKLIEVREEPFDRVLKYKLEQLDKTFHWALTRPSQGLLSLCELAHSMLRHSRQDLDQLPVLPETSLRRALELWSCCGQRRGTRLVLIGDDDLVSIPAAALGLRPTVLDLDPDLGAIIQLLSYRLGLDINVRQIDLKQPIPPEMHRAFDLFCTDPETSRECITLFVSRAIALVRPGGLGITACAEEWQPLLDEIISESQIERIALHRRFANYRDMTATFSHYRSDLHLLSVGKDSRPLVPARETFEGSLFPFGLDQGHHLLATLKGCTTTHLLEGPSLPDTLCEILRTNLSKVHLEDRNPLPLRVVTAHTDEVKVQATVSAEGRMLELQITPVPESEEEIRRIAKTLQSRFAPSNFRIRSLQRLE